MSRGLLGLFALLSVAAAPLVASAHLGHEVVRAERYLKLDVREGEARLVVTLTLGEEEGAALMRAADDDGDRMVGEDEAERHLAQWAAALSEELVLTAGGARVALEFGDGYFDPKGPVRRAVATLELVGRGRLPGGTFELELTDGMANREVFERTDVTFVSTPPVRILGDGLGDAREPVVPSRPARGAYAFGPSASPKRAVLEVESPEQGPSAWTSAAIAAAIMAAVALAWTARRRRAREGG